MVEIAVWTQQYSSNKFTVLDLVFTAVYASIAVFRFLRDMTLRDYLAWLKWLKIHSNHI